MGDTLTQIIREKTPLLVDSYVSQYGEKYRNVIQDKIDNVQFVFYVNPEDVDVIEEIISDNLERLTTFHFLKRIGIGDKELEVDTTTELLPFKDDKIMRLLTTFFDKSFFESDIEFIENHLGIYSFLIEGENPFEHFNILKERMKVLNKLHLCGVLEKDYLEFEHSELYRHAHMIYKRIADIALRYSKAINYECNKVKNIYNTIYDKNIELKIRYMKLMTEELIDLLPENTQKIILNDLEYELENLPGGELLFDLDSLGNTIDIFGPGLLESFSKESDLFLKEDFSEENPIIDLRLQYFKRQGICFSKKYFVDNMEEILEKYKDIIPSPLVTARVTKVREKYEMLYSKEATENMVLEGDISDLEYEDIEIMFDIMTGGYHKSEYDGDGIRSIIFINPLQTYQGTEMDHLIDHELRHVIEFNYFINGDTIEYKCGNAISVLTDEGITDKHFIEFNEAYTDKLSIEACEKRWSEGKYIFAPKIYLEEKFGDDYVISGYIDWLPNLKQVIADCEDIITKTRMDYTNSRLYKLLSFDELKRINELITAENVSDELESFSLKLKQRIKR